MTEFLRRFWEISEVLQGLTGGPKGVTEGAHRVLYRVAGDFRGLSEAFQGASENLRWISEALHGVSGKFSGISVNLRDITRVFQGVIEANHSASEDF